jgi:hypothetical protein
MDPIVVVSIVLFFTILIVIIGHALKVHFDRKKIESEMPIITNLLPHKSVNSDYNLL